MNLHEIEVGQHCRVVCVDGEGGCVRRVKELGLTTGVVCRMVRKAPFSGPMEIETPLAHLGIRTSEYLRIEVEVVTGPLAEAA